jgi:6-pyruvoyltetrahydropterin/6-carboxytetrahydropterin synthase
MATIRITKEFSFEMSHMLDGYDGACSQIHGHSYRMFVTVKGEPVGDVSNPKFGMVMDFGALKQIVGSLIIGRYDHSFVIRATEHNAELIEALKQRFTRIIVSDYQPTCENMATHFAEMIRRELPAGVELYSLKLYETATSFAEWYASDNY